MQNNKFRAWDVESRCMLSWEDIWNEVESVTPEEGLSLLSHIFRQDHYVLMQYTGLKDKNGVEIYEGDICNVKNKNTNPHEVRFHDSCFMFSYTEMKYYSEFEVIGNIYENPELRESVNANK